MALRENRDRSHENTSRFCHLCAMWEDIDGNRIERPAFWIGRYEDGMRILICDSCKSQGFPVIGTYHEVNGTPRYVYFGDGNTVAYSIVTSRRAIHSCKDLGSAMDAVRFIISNGDAIRTVRSMASNGVRRAMPATQRASFVIEAMS